MKNIKTNYYYYLFIFIIILIICFFYKKYQHKIDKQQEIYNNNKAIEDFLLNDSVKSNLAKNKKPILWVFLEYEYNSRNWLSFGSRSSTDLNQPYLYLTVKSIISKCDDSFYICLIDDYSFSKLLDNWSINMTKISDPVKYYMRELAMTKLLYKYGGMRVPMSFVCMKNLNKLYTIGTQNNKPFVCEMVDRSIMSTHTNFYPNMKFMGSPKNNEIIGDLIDFIQRIISTDFTSQTEFLGDFNRWCNTRIENNQINLIDGKLIGTKSMDNNQIIIDDLLTNDYIDIYPNTYGIYIPADEVLSRTNFEWFARMSPTQVLESSLIISKYLLLSNIPKTPSGTIEAMKERPNWVNFWRVPSGAPVWGLKPIDLGNDVPIEHYPDQL